MPKRMEPTMLTNQIVVKTKIIEWIAAIKGLNKI